MPAKFIKRNPQGLEGTVMAYVKEPNSKGFHDVILSSTSIQSFMRLYMTLKGVEDDYHLCGLLNLFEKKSSQDQEVISVRTTLQDICSIASKYDCDIIEIHIPKPKTRCMPIPIHSQIMEQYEDACMNEINLALNDYYTAYWKKQQTAKPKAIERKDCTKEEWRYIFSELHECLINPSANENYTLLEKDIEKLCKGIMLPHKLIQEMCTTAKQKKEHWKEKLYLYKNLIFSLEDEAYEHAAKIKEAFKKYS